MKYVKASSFDLSSVSFALGDSQARVSFLRLPSGMAKAYADVAVEGAVPLKPSAVAWLVPDPASDEATLISVLRPSQDHVLLEACLKEPISDTLRKRILKAIGRPDPGDDTDDA